MMYVVTAVLVLAAAVVLALPAEEKYTKSHDNIDVENILRNDRLVKKYVDCLLDKGSCTPEVMELKKNIPDALQNGCSKCSEKQKENAEKVIRHLIEHNKDLFDQLVKKYDPSGKYMAQYRHLAQEKGIKM